MARTYSLQRNNKYNNYKIRRLLTVGFVKLLVGMNIILAGAAIKSTIDLKKVEKEYAEQLDYTYATNEELYSVLDSPGFREWLENPVDIVVNVEKQTATIEVTEEEKLLKEYCGLYQLDYDIVYKKLSEITNGFSSEEYNNEIISVAELKKRKLSEYNLNKEAALVATLRYIKQTPGAFGLSNVSIDSVYETDMTYIEAIEYYSKMFNVDKNLVEAIIQSETGLGVNVLDGTNNLGNVKDGTNFMKLDNGFQSIIEVITILMDYEKKYGIKVDNISDNYEKSIELIGSYYAPKEDNNDNWVPNVKWNYEKLVNKIEVASIENTITDYSDYALYYASLGYGNDEKANGFTFGR